MGFFNILNVAATGLSAQRIRINVISSNLANANTTKTETGEPYKRKDVVFKELLEGEYTGGVRVEKVVEDKKPFVLKYEPGHPDANEEGYVQYPNVNPIEEMVNMIEASRSYEANVTVLNTAKQLAMRALDIGRA
ncbi:flagellar basal body rod protein FlgC [Calditerrivibrio nitroreducens]|uniref:Flagellar basal-body rod protein FlgC n=1 Tax=Calditerrivibrio nitroreducens (strain DSM 19672 / NBRC 101217 / Yu37-1) TaxID=768670 RepID=E4TGA7_CALNY|nr:flagellar basal body rod protein FlgC [Calditerrivibrio nitroreducens]ADR19694.1 flagellar basal-body rod protein FlgC [Calditerrivibrio nitroreducens DSM 19672]